jgi:hypothetical protein
MTEDNAQRILFLIAVCTAGAFVYREVRRGNTGIFRELFGWIIPARSPQPVSTFSTAQATTPALESRQPVAENSAAIMSNRRAYRYDRRHATQMRTHLHARKRREVGKPEAGSRPEVPDHLYVSDKGLSKGQIGELEAWVRGGRQGFTQERWSVVMAKRPKTIGEAVRLIEAKIAEEQKPVAPVKAQTVVKVAQEEEPALERFEPRPDAPAPEPYMSPETFMRVKHAA